MHICVDIVDIFVRIPRAAVKLEVSEYELLGRYAEMLAAMKIQGAKKIEATNALLFLTPKQIEVLMDLGVIGWNDGANGEDIYWPNTDTKAGE